MQCRYCLPVAVSPPLLVIIRMAPFRGAAIRKVGQDTPMQTL
jgi:hypothetical protein